MNDEGSYESEASSVALYRRARTLPAQIKELKAELPPKDSEGKRPPSPQLEQEIAELEKVSTFKTPCTPSKTPQD